MENRLQGNPFRKMSKVAGASQTIKILINGQGTFFCSSIACEQALLFGESQSGSRENSQASGEAARGRPLLKRSREARPNRRACSQASSSRHPQAPFLNKLKYSGYVHFINNSLFPAITKYFYGK